MSAARRKIHALRIILSFALLGAVIAGAFFGASDIDWRPAGAILGALAATAYKISVSLRA